MFLKHQHHIPRLSTSVRCLSTQPQRSPVLPELLQAATQLWALNPFPVERKVLGQPCSSAELLQRSHGAPAASVTHWCEGERQDPMTWSHTTPTKCCSCVTVTKPALFCTWFKCQLSELHDTNWLFCGRGSREDLKGFKKKQVEKLLKHKRFRNFNIFSVCNITALVFRFSKSVYACNQPHQDRCSIMKNTNSIFSGRAVGFDIPLWITGIRALSKSFR